MTSRRTPLPSFTSRTGALKTIVLPGLFVTLWAAFAQPCGAQAAVPTITGEAPRIFAPGVVSGPANDGAPAFSPDGKTLYFGRAGASWGFVMESRLRDGLWTEPTVASFSGQTSDSQPGISPDGTRLVFQSWRGSRPAGDSAGSSTYTRTSSLWMATRTPAGWGEPVRLPATVNISAWVFKPSLAADGTLYFMARTADAPTFRLYRSRLRDGTYGQAEPLSFSDGHHTDVDPAIAPDQSFLVFSSAGRGPAGDTHEHLYITFRSGDAWGPAIPLRYADDYERNPTDDGEAQLGPDHRTLYFTSGRTVHVKANRTRAEAAADFARLNAWDNGNNNVWSISLVPWLDARSAQGSGGEPPRPGAQVVSLKMPTNRSPGRSVEP